MSASVPPSTTVEAFQYLSVHCPHGDKKCLEVFIPSIKVIVNLHDIVAANAPRNIYQMTVTTQPQTRRLTRIELKADFVEQLVRAIRFQEQATQVARDIGPKIYALFNPDPLF